MDPQTMPSYPRSVPQVAPTTYKLRLETERLEAWKKSAETAGLKLAEWIRRRCDENGDTEDVLRIPEVPLAQRSVTAPLRATVDLAAVAEQTVTKRKEYNSLEHKVARRTGHPVGHECLECAGAYRFEEDLEKRERKVEKEEPKKFKRR